MYLNALPARFSINYRGDINYWRALLNDLEESIRAAQSPAEYGAVSDMGYFAYSVVNEGANPSDPEFQERFNDALRRYNAAKAVTPIAAPIIAPGPEVPQEITLIQPLPVAEVYVPADQPTQAELLEVERKQREAAEDIARMAELEKAGFTPPPMPSLFPETPAGAPAPMPLFPETPAETYMDFTFSNIPVTFGSVYVATFGRQPDMSGFNYWKGIVGGDLDLKEYDDFVYAGRLNGEKVNEQNVARIRQLISQTAAPISTPISAPIAAQPVEGGNAGLLIAAALAALTLLG
jgi:hypothetical protein